MGYDFERTHKNILESAGKHFLEQGFRNASIRKICQDAGVTNGAFYTHFKSKENLIEELVGPCLEGFYSLYGETGEEWNEIRGPEDAAELLDSTFASAEVLVHYVYAHSKEFRLLTCAAGGTVYEGFPRQLIEMEKEGTMAFMESCRGFMKRPENISENLAMTSSSVVVSSAFECFLKGCTEEETLRETLLASEYCIAGLKQVLGL